MVSIPFLIFAVVSLGIVASYLVVADLFFGDFNLVRQRLDAEFRKKPEDEAPRSPLFKNLDAATLAALPKDALEPGPIELPAAGPPPPPVGLRARLEILLDQANI